MSDSRFTARIEMWDLVVVGSGIVGLSVAKAWKERNPSDKIVIIDKEWKIASHSSGRNSGVLHAGFYYAPDSLKAKLTKDGNAMLRAFCYEHGVPIRETGKVVVTKSAAEIPTLEELYKRGLVNGCELELVDEQGLRELEPLARTVGKAIWSPLTAVSSPVGVTTKLAEVVEAMGCHLRLGVSVVGGRPGKLRLSTGEVLHTGHIVNAAGLYADKVAHWFGVGLDYQMLPFKGLYLYSDWADGKLTRQVYPVPDPRNPFLGVHATVTVEGRMKIGPTAIPALKREDYGKPWQLLPRELLQIARLYPRFLTSPHHNVAELIANEVPKYNKAFLVNMAKPLVPSIRRSQFKERGRPGVRAQLLHVPSKRLVMDFLVKSGQDSTHMLNVVSPAWTSSLAVGKYTVNKIHDGGFSE